MHQEIFEDAMGSMSVEEIHEGAPGPNPDGGKKGK